MRKTWKMLCIEIKQSLRYNYFRKGEIIMKKQIAIIFAALLAALPVSAYAACANDDISDCVKNQNCEVLQKLAEKCEGTDCTEITDKLLSDIFSGNKVEITGQNISVIENWLKEKYGLSDGIFSGSCTVPGTPDSSDKTDKPETPDAPETPDTPNTPDTPDTPDNGNTGSDADLGDTENYAYVKQVVELVNKERNKNGLASLTMDSELNRAAALRAKETVRSFSHTRPNGSSCFTALDEIGYSYSSAGENIAMGQSSPSEVVNAWMNSEGHRANILNSSFTKIGVGCHSNGSTLYWSQFFAS